MRANRRTPSVTMVRVRLLIESLLLALAAYALTVLLLAG